MTRPELEGLHDHEFRCFLPSRRAEIAVLCSRAHLHGDFQSFRGGASIIRHPFCTAKNLAAQNFAKNLGNAAGRSDGVQSAVLRTMLRAKNEPTHLRRSPRSRLLLRQLRSRCVSLQRHQLRPACVRSWYAFCVCACNLHVLPEANR